jgi:hypothetical protein
MNRLIPVALAAAFAFSSAAALADEETRQDHHAVHHTKHKIHHEQHKANRQMAHGNVAGAARTDEKIKENEAKLGADHQDLNEDRAAQH